MLYEVKHIRKGGAYSVPSSININLQTSWETETTLRTPFLLNYCDPRTRPTLMLK